MWVLVGVAQRVLGPSTTSARRIGDLQSGEVTAECRLDSGGRWRATGGSVDEARALSTMPVQGHDLALRALPDLAACRHRPERLDAIAAQADIPVMEIDGRITMARHEFEPLAKTKRTCRVVDLAMLV